MAAGQLGQHLGQLAGQLHAGGAAPTDNHGRQPPLLVGICGGRGRGDSLVDRRPHVLGVGDRVQRDGALCQAGDGEVVRPTPKCQHQPGIAHKSSLGLQLLAGQVEAGDLRFHEADPPSDNVVQWDPDGVRSPGAAGDPWQLGHHLVEVVPVDQR